MGLNKPVTFSGVHNLLLGRGAADAHTLASITGLVAAQAAQDAATAAKYTLPVTGVPLADLSAAVQTILTQAGVAFTKIGNMIVDVKTDYLAVGDGVTDDTDVIQDAIDAVYAAGGGVVFFPIGNYRAANIQRKTGVILYGAGIDSVITCLDNAHLASHNGSVADANGNFPTNVIGTTLNHDGGAAFDGGVRAKDENNVTYLVTDTAIINLTLDGNKANNPLGDVGLNASAMGACLSLHQAARSYAINCTFKNARLDGVHIGYSLHGGSDDCGIINSVFEGNTRCGIAQITGKRNRFEGNTIFHSGTGAGIDVEANLDDEVNYRHLITHNYVENGISIVSGHQAKLYKTIFDDNIIVGGATLGDATQIHGVKVINNEFIGSGGNALYIYGANYGGAYYDPAIVEGNTFTGFDYIVPTIGAGGHGHVTIRNNHFEVKYGMALVRPYKFYFEHNEVYFTGGVGTAGILSVLFSAVGTIANQGEVKLKSNKFFGSGIKDYITTTYGADPPTATAAFIQWDDNDINVTYTDTYPVNLNTQMTMRRNRIKKITNKFSFTNSANGSIFTDNEFEADANFGDLLTFSTTCKRVVFKRNKLKNIDLGFTRPQYCVITDNEVEGGKINILYSFTSGLVGENVIVNNTCVTETVIDFAFKIATGGGYDIANFSGDDIIENNIHRGSYTNRASIAATPMQLGFNTWNKKVLWAAAAPASGTWAVGDRVYNSAPAVGQPKSWACTVAGTPGTWVSEGNL